MGEGRSVTSTIDELMNPLVTTVAPGQSLGYVRELMAEHHISAVPVVNDAGEPVGIVTATDLLQGHSDDTLAESAMATPVATVSRFDGPTVAARLMRAHHLHHVVVTEAEEIVGIVSSFDLLRVVEELD